MVRHGESDRSTFTFGAIERLDLIAAVNTLVARTGLSRSRVGILGASAGGGIALQAATLAPDLAFVVADSPYADLVSIARREGTRRYGAVVAPLVSSVIAVAGWRASFDPAHVSPAREAAQIRCPVLLVHGRRDEIVPPRMAEALWQASGRQKIVWYDCTHYGAVLYIAPALRHVLDHFTAE